MSKVKIQGNASGTGVVTLTAPNTNTDRTITLPDEDITLGGGVDGIVSTADATAITIDSNENVGIGTTTPAVPLEVKGGASSNWNAHFESTNATGWGTKIMGGADGGDYSLLVKNYADTSLFEVRADGRGLSQFTAKMWCHWQGTGTPTIKDSHNVSSITDTGTGNYAVNFGNAMASANYSGVSDCNWYSWDSISHVEGQTSTYCRVYTIRSGASSYEDNPNVFVTVFGD